MAYYSPLRVQSQYDRRTLAEFEGSTCSCTRIILPSWTVSSHNVLNVLKAARQGIWCFAIWTYIANAPWIGSSTRDLHRLPSVTSWWSITTAHMNGKPYNMSSFCQTVHPRTIEAPQRIPQTAACSRPPRNNGQRQIRRRMNEWRHPCPSAAAIAPMLDPDTPCNVAILVEKYDLI